MKAVDELPGEIKFRVCDIFTACKYTFCIDQWQKPTAVTFQLGNKVKEKPKT